MFGHLSDGWMDGWNGWAHDIFFVRHVICSANSHDLANQRGLRVDMHMPYVKREPIRRSSNIVNIYKPPPLPPSPLLLPPLPHFRASQTYPPTNHHHVDIDRARQISYLLKVSR